MIPIPWDLRIPIRGGISPIMVPIISTPIPIHPVDSHTRAVTNITTPRTIDWRGIASCNFKSPFPTCRIIGTASNPAAMVIVSRRMKSAVGSSPVQVSIGYICFKSKSCTRTRASNDVKETKNHHSYRSVSRRKKRDDFQILLL